jgi:hypothetical protein
MHWTFNTHVGTFWIKPNQNKRFTLGIDYDSLGSYSSPEMAADDVFECETGFWPWDKQLTVLHPDCLHEWTLHE